MTLGEIGTLASILGLFVGVSTIIQAAMSQRTIKAMHATTERTLAAINAHWAEAWGESERRARAQYQDLKAAVLGSEKEGDA